MKTSRLTKAVIAASAVGAVGAAYVLVQKKKHAIERGLHGVNVHGFVVPGDEACVIPAVPA